MNWKNKMNRIASGIMLFLVTTIINDHIVYIKDDGKFYSLRLQQDPVIYHLPYPTNEQSRKSLQEIKHAYVSESPLYLKVSVDTATVISASRKKKH
ncbi:MAG: hypothetical protein HQK50_19385 [Oligoflexia bacterium]|nr:hypothetical protein [Oligoflexia bacterium]MBF0367740.1 hypothetical protein [Oligoflexia bacterium]